MILDTYIYTVYVIEHYVLIFTIMINECENVPQLHVEIILQ